MERDVGSPYSSLQIKAGSDMISEWFFFFIICIKTIYKIFYNDLISEDET